MLQMNYTLRDVAQTLQFPEDKAVHDLQQERAKTSKAQRSNNDTVPTVAHLQVRQNTSGAVASSCVRFVCTCFDRVYRNSGGSCVSLSF